MQVLENKLLLPKIKFKKINIMAFLYKLFKKPRIYIEIEPNICKKFDPITDMMERGNYEERIF
jgi:hypothetical protein